MTTGRHQRPDADESAALALPIRALLAIQERLQRDYQRYGDRPRHHRAEDHLVALLLAWLERWQASVAEEVSST